MSCLCTLASDTSCELNVLWHDGDSLGVNRAQVGVLEQTDQVRLRCLLQCQHGGTLEAKIGLEVLRDLTHKSLERQLADQQLSALLVFPDLTERNSARTIPVRLLHAASRRSGLAGSLGRQLFSWSFTSGRFSCGLLGSCHLEVEIRNEIRQLMYVSGM